MLRHLPNLISVFRVLLVPPVVWLMVQGRYGEALALFVIAGASDGLDGYLAKHFGWVSRFGSIIDPLADKLLLTASFFTLAWLGHLPLWLAVLVIARDLVIVIGGLAYHYLVGKFSMAVATFPVGSAGSTSDIRGAIGSSGVGVIKASLSRGEKFLVTDNAGGAS